MLNSLVVKSIIKKDIESGEISGTAEKASKDSEGNVITETYATKKESESSDKLLSTAIKEEETRSNEYTDQKIADLINGAPTTLDTLKEIADAMDENQDVVKALDESIGTKANASDLTDHTGNTNNPHNVTAEQIGLGNVGNFKAVSTAANQVLSDTEKSNARTNIGAGTSSFSGSYNDLIGIPSIPSKTSELENDSDFATNESMVQEVAKIVAGAPEEFDTLKEMSDWLTEHEDNAAEMNTQILKNKSDIENLQTSKADVDVVNENFANIHESLTQLEVSDIAGGKNLANPNNFIENKIVGFETGAIIDYQNYFVTGYIEIEPNTTYTKQGFLLTMENWYYDENKNAISVIATDTDTFTTPSNAKYVVLSALIENKSICMLEKGSTATTYEPFIHSVKILDEEVADIKNDLDKYVLNSDDKSIGNSEQENYLNIDFSNYDNGIYYIYGKTTDNNKLATAHVAVEDFVVSIIDRSNPSIVFNGSTLTFFTTSWWIDVYVRKINVANGYIGSNIASINESLTQLEKSNEGKMGKENPTGTGAFSMNRKADTTVGDYSTTEGSNCEASAICSHAEGSATIAKESCSHAEGSSTTASGFYSHAEGYKTTASNTSSHAEGNRTTASGDYGSHAEGNQTTAKGNSSHAEGFDTTASGLNSHSEGYNTKAEGDYSHSGGYRTIAGYNSQTAIGKYNENKKEDIFEVGNGTSDTSRSNALELTNTGDLKIAGGLLDTVISMIVDHIYEGVDLTVKFASEIANYSDEWAWIKSRVTDGNYSGIHVGDYIPITCSNGYVLNAQVAGINTYTGSEYMDEDTGDTINIVNHIDFICKELWNNFHAMNKVAYNNGNGNNLNPFIASDLNNWLNSMSGTVPNSTSDPSVTTSVDYTSGGVFYYLPDKLKNQIIEKSVVLPVRYPSGGVVTSDTGCFCIKTGKLWIPSEVEIYGTSIFGSAGYSCGFVQYPLFAYNMNAVKRLCVGGGMANWWLLSSVEGYSSQFVIFSRDICGLSCSSANNSYVAAPVCFRI